MSVDGCGAEEVLAAGLETVEEATCVILVLANKKRV